MLRPWWTPEFADALLKARFAAATADTKLEHGRHWPKSRSGPRRALFSLVHAQERGPNKEVGGAIDRPGKSFLTAFANSKPLQFIIGNEHEDEQKEYTDFAPAANSGKQKKSNEKSVENCSFGGGVGILVFARLLPSRLKPTRGNS